MKIYNLSLDTYNFIRDIMSKYYIKKDIFGKWLITKDLNTKMLDLNLILNSFSFEDIDMEETPEIEFIINQDQANYIYSIMMATYDWIGTDLGTKVRRKFSEANLVEFN